MLFSSVKKINRLLKEISRLLSKGMLNIYFRVSIEEKLTFSKLRFSRIKKFVSRSVFAVFQLIQISLNFKIMTLIIWNYDVLKSKSRCSLFNKNINFNKTEKESKMENSTHNFRETNPVLKLV